MKAKKALLFFLFVVLATSLFVMGCAPKDKNAGERKSYIVVYKKAQKSEGLQSIDSVEVKAHALSAAHDIPAPEKSFSAAIQGSVFPLTDEEAETLAADETVAYVEEDSYVYANTTQNNPTWGLDRIDQASLPLNSKYTYPDGGMPVNVYVIDTGVNVSHQDFGGRASSGSDFVDRDNNADDCNGHGTHVSGTIAGRTYGVAKSAKIIGVRVLDCSGGGRISDVIAGVDWVTQNHKKPAVANMSLGGGASQALDDAVRNSVQAGVTFVVAAGNDNAAACSGSPSRVPEAITVGAVTKSDARSSFSNYGSCVDIFAPGSDITSAWIGSSGKTNTISGTSMASPHVAGVAALYLSKNSSATPKQVTAAIVQGAISGKVADAKAGSPNLLLNIGFVGTDPGNTPVDEPPKDGSLKSGDLVKDLADVKGNIKKFKIKTSGNDTKLVVEIMGGSGDVDLYVRRGSEPTLSVYDCRPYQNGNSEKCEFTGVGQGEYFIQLHAYSAYANVSLKVQVTAGGLNNDPCTACATETGILVGSGHAMLHPKGTYYQSVKDETHSAFLKAANGADYDLFLKKWDGTKWVNVASSATPGGDESIKYQGQPGFYTVEVRSFLGAGAYQVWLKRE